MKYFNNHQKQKTKTKINNFLLEIHYYLEKLPNIRSSSITSAYIISLTM